MLENSALALLRLSGFLSGLFSGEGIRLALALNLSSNEIRLFESFSSF